jgi:NhaA family Na+:H+ antiporter
MSFIHIRNFLKHESAGGITLFTAAILAILLDNSPLSDLYQTLFRIKLLFGHPLLFWINEGLMAVFFLLVGLELKREFKEGELSAISKIILPGIAAFGGMLIPAVIYSGLNYTNSSAMRGWAIPVATDIAFALGVLSLFSTRVPQSLRIFLLALAIFDDLGAIIIIAVFYSHDLSIIFLALSGIVFSVLGLLNFFGVKKLTPYLLLGVVLWICLLKSGIHATIAGVLLAFIVPANKNSSFESPLNQLEQFLLPWVAYGIMPLFALANAGISFYEISHEVILDSIVLGIVAGLCIGKQIGIFGFTWLAIHLGLAKLPNQCSWLQLYGISLICGIGFTMSLFLGTLAFQDNQSSYLINVRLGVLFGSLISGIMGAIVLLLSLRKRRCFN